MIPKPQRPPPRWWGPHLSPLAVALCRPWRSWWLRRQRVLHVEVRDVDHVRRALGQSVLLTPNHPGSADPGVLYHVADQLQVPFYFMAGWEMFARSNCVVQRMLQRHGVFSVNRDGTDLKAVRTAVAILRSAQYPLVIFPEGEVYHVNDRVTPFRYGAATIAITAARRCASKVLIVPTALKYHYLEDPTDGLLEIMRNLESRIYWRPRPDLPLAQRIYRFAEGALAIKELEYLGRTCAGALPDRVRALSDFILRRLEKTVRDQIRWTLPARTCEGSATNRSSIDCPICQKPVTSEQDAWTIWTTFFSSLSCSAIRVTMSPSVPRLNVSRRRSINSRKMR